MRERLERELMGVGVKKGVWLWVKSGEDGIVLREKEGIIEMGNKVV